jgi:hypothetical protein
MQGGGGGVSAKEYSCAHGSQINFGDLTPYLTEGYITDVKPYTESMHYLQFYFKMQYFVLTLKMWKRINSIVARKTYGCCGQR